MRISSAILFILLVISCNNKAGKKENNTDSVKQIIQIPETPVPADTIFTGFGTEPFWSVYVINNSKIVFHPADEVDKEVPYVTPVVINVNTKTYKSFSATDTLELTIFKKDCSDGMSDKTHSYEVTLLINKTKYSGCGRTD
ncbi:MAG: hypothetical protein IPI68_14075 [Chitinophagaceae bacterium]|nr:hypothetical protein [Chitinophagaceae bacterium]